MGDKPQNEILLTINLKADVARHRPSTEHTLIDQFTDLLVSSEVELNAIFRSTCHHVAVGYALLRKAIKRSGMRNFKSAMEHDLHFQNLTAQRKERIYTDIKYIRCIYENWNLIVRNCTLPIMTNVDVRRFPLWKLAKCINLNFVEKENEKDQQARKKPTQREYELSMVDDIIENVPGSTQRLLDVVGNDNEQIIKIGDDFQKALSRRANGEL